MVIPYIDFICDKIVFYFNRKINSLQPISKKKRFLVRSYSVYHRLEKILGYMINQGCCFSTVRHDTGSTGSCRKFLGRKEVFPLFLRVLAFTDNSIALTPSLLFLPKHSCFQNKQKQGTRSINNLSVYTFTLFCNENI